MVTEGQRRRNKLARARRKQRETSERLFAAVAPIVYVGCATNQMCPLPCLDYEPQVGAVIDNRWRVGYTVGAGSFGQVFGCTDLQTMSSGTQAFVIKVHKWTTGSDFEREVHILTHARQAKNNTFVPLLHGHGRIRCVHNFDAATVGVTHGSSYLVMERLGVSLSQLIDIEFGDRQPIPIHVVTDLAVQMLHCLRFVHSLGYAHNDVKKNNFAVSPTSGLLQIYDFGRATQFFHLDTMQWTAVDAKTRTDYGGPLWYASLNGHCRRSLGPHDDLQALLYMALHMATGTLPWLYNFNPPAVHQIKLAIADELLYAGMPIGWLHVQRYVRDTLSYGEWPDYDYVELCLRNQILAA